ncbi:MAG: murein biosynthesis integral membrane protein MurJ [Gammaproteobacteria bacterium]
MDAIPGSFTRFFEQYGGYPLSSKLLQSTAIVGAMTLLSRILGFVRDTLVARLFGADSETDAFFVAFKTPDIFRRLFAEGAFSQAFVPILADYKETGSREALKNFIDRTAGTLAVILLAFTAVGVLAAPVLVWIFAPGFAWNGERYDLTVEMLRITFPYVLFICCTAFAGSILNSFGKFAVPAVTPALLNVCVIASAIWLAPRLDQPILALGWAVFAAGVVQLVFQLPALHRLGLIPRLKPGFHDPAVRRVLAAIGPATFGVSVTQINLVLDTLIASFLMSGSVSWLYYSNRLVEFPLGLLGIALGTAILPALSGNVARNDTKSFSDSLDWGLRWLVLIGLPATLGLVILAEPVLATLFQSREFSARDVLMAGQSLKAYSSGLLAYMLVKLLVPAFSSRRDMKTPVRYGLYAMIANFLLNLGLVFPFGHAGLALATSSAAWINACLLLHTLLKDRIFEPRRGWSLFLARILFANVTMGALLLFSFRFTDWSGSDAIARVVNLGFWIVAAAGVYGAALLLSGMRVKDLRLRTASLP